MTTPKLAGNWQSRLDKDFPHGAIAQWVDGPDEHSYHVPRIEVVSMRGLDPVVFMHVPDWGRDVTGTVASYEVVQHSPHLVARVKLSDHGGGGREMLWSAGLHDRERRGMQADRSNSLKASDEGRLYDPMWTAP